MTLECQLRPLSPSDVPALTRVLQENRQALADSGPAPAAGGTLVRNLASRRVLTKDGFVLYGLAPDYLRIAGRWQEHALYQVVRPAVPQDR